VPYLTPERRRVLIRALAALLAALAAVGITVEIIDENRDGRPDRGRVTVGPREFVELPPVQPGASPIVADTNQEQQPDELGEARRSSADLLGNADLHEDTRDETPPGVRAATLQQGRIRTARLAEQQLARPERPAGAQAYSCQRAPVVNQSALSSRRVGVILHFTVSQPGSLDAIRGLFNRPSFGASSNYGFELFNLRCQQWVPEHRKAWAQGAANSAYVSIEIITNDRSRASWLATPALRRGVLAALVRDIARRHGAPLQLVDPVGCVFPPGITDHDRLECGNTHWDVGRNFPWDIFMRQVRAGTTSQRVRLRTPEQRRRCDVVNFHRRRAHAIGRWYPSRRARAEQLKQQLPPGSCPSRFRGEPSRR
jgi:N-acetyl-anhydromuramyl-L-alanine amidase AmpD